MTAKFTGRLAGALILAVSFLAVNVESQASMATAAESDPVVEYANADAAMNAAQDQARSHLDAFLETVMMPNGMARNDAAIKVAIPTDGDNKEVIWVSPFGKRDGGYIGALANEPRDLPDLHAGDAVSFTLDQVRDWSFWGEDGKLYGNYTTRVMLDHIDPEQAAQIASVLADTPAPAHW